MNRRTFLAAAASLAASSCGGIARGPASRDDGGAGREAGDDAGTTPAPTADAGPEPIFDAAPQPTADAAPVAMDAAADVGALDAASPCASGTLIATLPFSAYPQLGRAGGSVQTKGGNGYQDPVCGQDNIIVVTPVAGQYAALSGSCTHACCTLYYDGARLVCPCHDATFGLDGTPDAANSNLPPLQVLHVCAVADALYVSV